MVKMRMLKMFILSIIVLAISMPITFLLADIAMWLKGIN